MKRLLRVLIVEDSDDDCRLVLRELSRGDYDVQYTRVQIAEAMRAALANEAWDVILSDYAMPEFGASEALRVLKESGIDIPFIIVSGTIGEDTAVEALKGGAHDFLAKGRLARLRPAIERELREVDVRRRHDEAEVSRRATEARFRAIMETATDGVVAADQDGRITYVNPAAEKLFGYAASEIVGQAITRLMPDRYYDAHRTGLSRYVMTGEANVIGRTVEFVGRRKDGSEFPMDLSLGTWSTDDKKYFAGIVRDVTDRKEVQARLLVADRMASVGTLAAGVAHEINNPLAAVMANVDAAIRDVAELASELGTSKVVSGLRDELTDARDAAERVRLIVRDLKVFSRGEQEKRGPVDVERVIDSTLQMAWNEIRHRARLVKDYAHVPPVEATESRLGQVFLNLVVNAAQAITEGQADKNEIRIATSATTDRVVIEISDTGRGIPPDVMKRLFTPFVTTKPVGMGTGLGLSICHRIVTDFGGEIGVASRSGGGTIFRVALPLARTQVKVARPSSQPPVRAVRRGRVLVIDDDPMIARAVQRALSAEHDVIAMRSAGQAFDRLLAGERFDVILCDLMMPEMTGMDFYDEVTKTLPEQAESIIFLTGGAFTPRARDFLDEVPNETVEKPFDSLHLRALINDHVR